MRLNPKSLSIHFVFTLHRGAVTLYSAFYTQQNIISVSPTENVQLGRLLRLKYWHTWLCLSCLLPLKQARCVLLILWERRGLDISQKEVEEKTETETHLGSLLVCCVRHHFPEARWRNVLQSPIYFPAPQWPLVSPRLAPVAGWTRCHGDSSWPGPTGRDPLVGFPASVCVGHHPGWHKHTRSHLLSTWTHWCGC